MRQLVQTFHALTTLLNIIFDKAEFLEYRQGIALGSRVDLGEKVVSVVSTQFGIVEQKMSACQLAGLRFPIWIQE
jgi:hypothetical protein